MFELIYQNISKPGPLYKYEYIPVGFPYKYNRASTGTACKVRPNKRRKSKSKRKVSGRVIVVESKYIDLQWEMPN